MPEWWADGRYDLRRKGEGVEVRAGDKTVAVLPISWRGKELLILDPNLLSHNVYRLRRKDYGR
jgi:hypothetical protein